MSRPGPLAAALAVALAVLVASGPAAAQAPRYEGYRIPTVAHPPSERPSLRSAGAQTVPLAKGDSFLRSEPERSGGDGAESGGSGASGLAYSDTTRVPDEWLGRDKALHAGGSFLLTLSGQYVLTDKAGLSDARALPVSAAAALALGLVKEVSDSRRARHPLFSWRDLAADAAGVALAALVVGL